MQKLRKALSRIYRNKAFIVNNSLFMQLERTGRMITVLSLIAQGADSVDLKLVNLIQRGDIAVTQDYGLAAMCLSKGAFVLHQDGKQYTEENISGLLEFRAVAKKIRRAGVRLKGIPKRSPEQDQAFAATLRQIIMSLAPSNNT